MTFKTSLAALAVVLGFSAQLAFADDEGDGAFAIIRPGSVQQIRAQADCTNAPCSTGSAQMVRMGGVLTVMPFLPHSDLLVECTFEGLSDLSPANTAAVFQLYEVSGAPTPISIQHSLAAILTSYGARAVAPVSVRALVANRDLAPRSFALYGRMSIAPGYWAVASVRGKICTVTEIAAQDFSR